MACQLATDRTDKDLSMRVLLLNNLPAPYFLPVFRHLAVTTDWELLVCFASRWRSDLGWAKGSIETTIPARTVYLESDGGEGSMRLAKGLALLRLLRRERPDYLVCYGYTQVPQLTLLVWALLTGTPFALIGDANIHCDRARGLKRMLKWLWLRLLTARAAAILTIGTASQRFWEKYGARSERTFAVPFAVDNRQFKEGSAQQRELAAEKLRQLGLEGRVVFISVGRLIERKNVELLIRAVRQLDPAEPAALLIAGDGEQRERLLTEAGGDPRIVFLGNIRPNDLPFCYSMADALILAARDEPWGLVTNEAMACGLAVIAHAECGSAIDLVCDRNGITLRSFNVEEVVAAMRRLIANPAELEQMKQYSRVKIDEWSVEAAAGGLIAAIERTSRRL